MPMFKKGDRVLLLRGCKGLKAGAIGTVVKPTDGVVAFQQIAGVPIDSSYWKIRWNSSHVETGLQVRDHKATTLDFARKTSPTPQSGPKPLSGVAKRLALLDYDAEDASLSNLLSFSDSLKQIATASRQLRSLKNSVRHIALYRGPDLNLYLITKGAEVSLVKEVDGTPVETLSVPLQVFVHMLQSLPNDAP